MFLSLTLNIFHTFSSISIVDFEQVNINGEVNVIRILSNIQNEALLRK